MTGEAENEELPPRIRALVNEGDVLWDRFHEEVRKSAWHGFVPADYQAVYRELAALRGQAITFLEWGSGNGVITMMADMLGFEAYGIEIDERLVAIARGLAKKHGSRATFVVGTFVPEAYEFSLEHGDPNFRSVMEGTPGYEELDLELSDFDLVYAYPWPDEEPFFHDIMRQCGRKNSLFLTFDAFVGIELHRPEPFDSDESE